MAPALPVSGLVNLEWNRGVTGPPLLMCSCFLLIFPLFAHFYLWQRDVGVSRTSPIRRTQKRRSALHLCPSRLVQAPSAAADSCLHCTAGPRACVHASQTSTRKSATWLSAILMHPRWPRSLDHACAVCLRRPTKAVLWGPHGTPTLGVRSVYTRAAPSSCGTSSTVKLCNTCPGRL